MHEHPIAISLYKSVQLTYHTYYVTYINMSLKYIFINHVTTFSQ